MSWRWLWAMEAVEDAVDAGLLSLRVGACVRLTRCSRRRRGSARGRASGVSFTGRWRARSLIAS